MKAVDVYRVKYTAIVTGWATFAIPHGEKVGHFVDGSETIDWDMSTIRDIEVHDDEFLYSEDDVDCSGGCEVEDADGPDSRAPYPVTDAPTEGDNDDGPPF